jgi:proteasome lid subunit RPN8/RPN11
MPQIVQDVYDRMVAHAMKERPNECCGLLAGTGDRITTLYAIENVASNDPRIAALSIPEDRQFRYMMDPAGQLAAIKEIRRLGLTLMGIYHSHPHSEAFPSETDVRLAFYSDVFYFIISLAKETQEVRAFSIVKCQIAEVGVERYR